MTEQTDRHPQILIVEDEPSIGVLMEMALVNQDHWQATTVVEGKQAIEAWQSGKYDVIIMDIKMPDMNGIEATRAIREREREAGRKRTPIIAFTACVAKQTCQECFDAGVDDFLPKPTKMASLVEAVAKYIPGFP